VSGADVSGGAAVPRAAGQPTTASHPDDELAREVAALDAAIDAIERQRDTLGDEVVATALAPLGERRAELQARLEGEQRKLVTVLFADLVDFTVLSRTLDAEDVRTLVNEYFARWHSLIEANGGVVEKFIGDAVMAVFGLRRSREEDPHLAIRAALAMRDSLDALNAELRTRHGVSLAMRVGIDTGDVVVGRLDERPGQQVAVIGETVNRASRLQSAAPTNGVLISTDTYRHVRGSFSFQPLPGLQLKGIAEPVDGYVVLNERPRGFRLDAARGVEGVDTRTVGRDRELHVLQDLFRDVEDERGYRIVTIVGDAGVGKTRLMSELDRWMAEIPEPVWWFRGRSSPWWENRPNALLRDVLVTRLEIQDSDGPEVVRQKWDVGIARVFGDEPSAAQRSRVLARWLAFDLGDEPGADPDGRALREVATAFMAESFQRLAQESPVVVLLEDLHWADDATLDWMDTVAPQLQDSPIFIVATARPSLLERRPRWGEGLAHHARLDLHSLSPRASSVLVGEILQHAERVPAALTELIVSAADGNAFYIEELVTWLIDAGVITRDGPQWHVHEERIAGVAVPPTLKGVMQSRLDSLSPAEHHALQRAAVIGRVFWDAAVDSLAAANGVGVHASVSTPTDDLLQQLRERAVVFQREQSTFDGTSEFVFKHALLRDATYESVLRSQRQVYHGLAARWLEEVSKQSRRSDQYASLIADHYAGAGEGAAAARWYLRAGLQATSVHALAEAGRVLSRGLEVVPDDALEMRFEFLIATADVLEQRADRSAQIAVLDELDELAAQIDVPLYTVRALLARAARLFSDSDYVAEVETARRAVDLAASAGLTAVEVDARLWCGKGLTWDGRNEEAEAVLREALAGARRIGERFLEAEVLRYLGVVANNRSEFPQAVELLERARSIHHERGDVENEVVSLAQLASVHYNQGRFADARVALEECVPILMASGYKYRQAVTMGNLGSVYLAEGDISGAHRYLVDALELSHEVADKESIAVCRTLLGDLHRRTGDVAAARDQLRQALELAAEVGMAAVTPEALVYLALTEADAGELAAARARADQSARESRLVESPAAEAAALLATGRIELRADEPVAAEAPLRAALALADELGLDSRGREAAAALAVCELSVGRRTEAAALVETVLAHLDAPGLMGTQEPSEVCTNCWRVLSGLDDERAGDVLAAGAALLERMSIAIDDPDMRAGALTRVPAQVALRAAIDAEAAEQGHA
jgi:predicted ATPase/class 3 adenylate cyclase